MSNPILDTFFEETEELLEALAEGLASMQGGDHEAETVNSVFRAVHSIKGGAGAFKMTELVGFAHHFETVLDAVRSNALDLTPPIMHTLTRSADFLSNLVEAARSGDSISQDVTAGFLAALQQCFGEKEIESVDAWDNFEFAAITLDIGGPAVEVASQAAAAKGFMIVFRPDSALYSNGHEPALLFAALADLGTMNARFDQELLPEWEDFDPQDARLSWTIELQTEESESQVLEVFEFVQGICELSVSPMNFAAPAPPGDATGSFVPTDAKIAVLESPGLFDNAVRLLTDEAAAPVSAKPPEVKPAEKTASEASETAASKGPKPTLRVDLERVDRLINTVGELIINQAMIAQRFADMTETTDDDLVIHIENYRLLARDIQEGVMAIRAQPVKSLFQRMSRIVREAADATGKSAELITIGEGTEVDKTVVERLADPLTHMVRNSVDHGLESPEARIAAGKPATGIIRLAASHRSGSVFITVKDDGAGLNRHKILGIAKKKGLIAQDAELSDSEIDSLLFLPGFSTAETVSNLSGRGVGLDVVRNSVAALGGRVSITSVPGQGTEFTITLPLTLAVMDGMVVTVAGETLVVPITSIIETIRPLPGDLHRIGTDDMLLSIRGRMIPVVDVARSLGFTAKSDQSMAPLLLLVESETLGECALVVDAVQDQRQVVIKSLESNFGTVIGVSAATVLGDGRIALILDPEAIAANRMGNQFPSVNFSPNHGRSTHANL
jgi:two-component system chemotaxis sensor kinase CheA